MEDFVVVGAGIAGASAAWFLRQNGKRVLLIDKSRAFPTGGSMAAGAFISPKIGKGSPLQSLTNEAFDFSWRFYKRYFSEFFHQDGVLRVPKSLDDAKKFQIYKEFNYPNYQIFKKDDFKRLGLSIEGEIGFFFPDGGDCDAQNLIKEMAKEIEFLQMEVELVEFRDGFWVVKGGKKKIITKHLILALGYENNKLNIDMEYMGIKSLWGSRGDYRLKSKALNISLHKDFSLSSVRDGFVKIGATHIKSKNPCLVCDGNPTKSLELKAKGLLKGLDIELKKLFCGHRSGSRDFFPVVGEVIDVQETYNRCPNITKGAKVEPTYYQNLYVINGVGGRGFVFGPYLANILIEHIISKKRILKIVHPDRLFIKWIRKTDKFKDKK